jgi:hypothetical protein
METRRGTFSRDGNVLINDVELSITADHRRADGRDGWRGEAWIPTEVHVFPGDRLRLQLHGSEPETVLIDRVTVDPAASRMLIRFTPA